MLKRKSKAVKDPMCKSRRSSGKNELLSRADKTLKGICFFEAKLIEATETVQEELSGLIKQSSVLHLEAHVASNVVPLPRSCGLPQSLTGCVSRACGPFSISLRGIVRLNWFGSFLTAGWPAAKCTANKGRVRLRGERSLAGCCA